MSHRGLGCWQPLGPSKYCGYNWKGFCIFSMYLLTIPGVKSWLFCIRAYSHVSEPHFSHLYNIHNHRDYPIGLLWAFKELNHIKHHLACSKYSNKNNSFPPCYSKFGIYNMKNWRILAVWRVRARVEDRVSSHLSIQLPVIQKGVMNVTQISPLVLDPIYR